MKVKPKTKRMSSSSSSGLIQRGVRALFAAVPQTRDPRYARVNGRDLDFFRGLLGARDVITGATDKAT